MTMTSDAIRHDLAKIDTLIALLGGSGPVDEDDFSDLRWLKQQVACMKAILASRRALKGKKVVSLDHWRDGGAAAKRTSIAA